MVSSYNGYRALETSSKCRKWIIPGTDRHIYMKGGHIGFILAYFILWFHERVEKISPDNQWDDWGWAYRPVRGTTSKLSNHASGTAVDINATQHPLGKRGTFTWWQVKKIHWTLRRLKGHVFWGGDYQYRADEMHFEAVKKPGVRAVARKLRRTKRGKRIMKANRHYMPKAKR